MNQAYVCVYRHITPAATHVKKTELAALADPRLSRFLLQHSSVSSFYDWGDDPSFFSALSLQGSTGHAGWGVCRPDVRRKLDAGDLVVFFCAKPGAAGQINYYFLGVGTVRVAILDRRRIWSTPRYRQYSQHYNILARFVGNAAAVQHETFYPYHADWQHRLQSPYIIFDPDKSSFNLSTPLLVSTSTNGTPDRWGTTTKVARLERLLFGRFSIGRRLRTSRQWNAHRHLNLTSHLAKAGISAANLRASLLPLV